VRTGEERERREDEHGIETLRMEMVEMRGEEGRRTPTSCSISSLVASCVVELTATAELEVVCARPMATNARTTRASRNTRMLTARRRREAEVEC
jgi:hypothetical protein